MTMGQPTASPFAFDRGEVGSALVTALLATVLLTTLGVGLVMLSRTETAIAGNYRIGNETFYAADAAVERVVQDVLLVPRWNDILSGVTKSSFVDDTLTPTAPSGEPLNLTQLTTELQSQADASNPWGPNNPQWRLFAYGPLSSMLGQGSLQSNTYVAVWIADEPSESDNDAFADTNGVISVFALAIGPQGTRRAVEVTVAKTDMTELERGQIAQRGQEELNQRARKAAVELPGTAPTVSDMNLETGGMTVR
jgi:hypothetical protein